jgi:Zn-dependent protease
MFDFSPEGIIELLLRLPVILLALTIHELAHAWSADRLGDPTARYMGRVSLNPLRHLDPLGTLCLMFAPIGWAKPVPVNPLNFRHPGRDDILVSAAGPASNLLQAIIYCLLLRLPWQTWAFNTGSAMPGEGPNWAINWLARAGGRQQIVLVCWYMVSLGVLLNIGLAVFNMLPFFPLDGHHIARENLRGEARIKFIEFQQFGPFVILALVLLDNYMGARGNLGPISWPIIHALKLLVAGIGGGHAHLLL